MKNIPTAETEPAQNSFWDHSFENTDKLTFVTL